jgi:hypothetical protein
VKALLAGIWKVRTGLAPVWLFVALVSVGPAMNALLTPVEVALILAAAAIPWAVLVRIKAPSKPHRVFGDLVYTFIAVWIIMADVQGWAAWRPLGVSAMIAMLLFGSLWWSSRRNRLKIRLDKAIHAWPKVAEKFGMGKSWLEDHKVSKAGWTAILRWAPGEYKLRAVLDLSEEIEGARGLPEDSLSIERIKRPDGKAYTDRVKLEYVSLDPHNKPIPWPGPRVTSIMQAIELGFYPDGKPEKFTWWTKGVGGFHCLIAGLTRSGKSSLIDVLIGSYAEAVDVAILLADFKGGESLLKWAPMSCWFEKDVPGAIEQLRALERIVKKRGELKAARGWSDGWQPSKNDPVYIYFIDEVAELLGSRANSETLNLIESIGRMGAGLGVLLVLATQYPTVGGAIGSSQLKTQLAWRACFRLQAQDQLYYILPNAPKGVDPSRIPKDRRGTCFVDAEGEFRPTPLRVMFMQKAQLDAVVRERWWCTTPMDPQAAAVAGEAFEKRIIWTQDMLDQLKAGKTIEDLTKDDFTPEVEEETDTEIPTQRARDKNMPIIEGPASHIPLSELAEKSASTENEEAEREAMLARNRQDAPEDESRAKLTAFLDEAGPKGGSPADLVQTCGRSERWIHRELQRRLEAGSVVHVGRGRYVSAAHANAPSQPAS